MTNPHVEATVSRGSYYTNGNEVDHLTRAFEQRVPVMLTGPTGCGKTRLVDHVGRFTVSGGDVVWHDGPLTRAVKDGAICYMDEVVEARHDSLAVLHSLTDHRRMLYLDRCLLYTSDAADERSSVDLGG